MIDESTLKASMQRHAREVRGAQDSWQARSAILAAVVLVGGFTTFLSLRGIDRKVATLRESHEATDRLVHALKDSNDRLWYRLDLERSK